MSGHAAEPFAKLPVGPKPPLRRFHQARWDEPIIFEQSRPGQRGIAVPGPGAPAVELPDSVRRAAPPALPEMSQLHVLRHYVRLSQESLGVDLNVDVGQGTCTMKYSPKVNDSFARAVAELHPLQHPDTLQGVLEIYWRLERMLAEISGMARVSLQPGSGSAAIYANIAMIRAYHAARGEEHRDQVITTMFSHPSNAACAKTAGYEVITLMPDADGYPDIKALRAAVGPRTAALLITNPEDTGIFNPRIAEFVELVHQAGGLACYDQANANGILGITRARDAGFDLCHFNLHKTFSTPHACGGPAAGACGVSEALAEFLPGPVVAEQDGRFSLVTPPRSIGKIRPFLGVTPNVVRAYAWIMTLGAEGLRQVAETAALNNNYLMHKVLQIPGASAPWDRRRIEQVRYSWQELSEETGVHSEEIGVRAADFGVHYWTSHHPYLVPEPFTLEPTESYSKEDLDEYAAILAHVASEARTDPELVKGAPYNSPIHKIDPTPLDDPRQWAPTWRAYVRKHLA
ncbi:glycine dehydrogenase [Sphaerisporangium krabiense]|uniref:glycine dehydrogenase (aminomethyl-transferring) n=1 Tax=Sphaerisporangium krabiense TaxID=763782 RepID=A0A7W8ZAL5_9ACTN|nr:aminomethyl-transferring glycine dehydrogenase subunit GcvPB [Sphaerisporangium krabiense]MBB5630539.1 glycine dehydrogenase subunit 2 [Sphaerisporangium krabiense]GII62507.1 glycine dehydrogenase [Sphaerisporangium krabiense]